MSRRALIAAGLAGAVVAVEGCGSDPLTSAVHAAPAAIKQRDVAILNQALELEYRAVHAYTAVGPLLDGTAAEASQQFLGQELAHAAKLQQLITAARGDFVLQGSDYPLGRVSGAQGALTLLREIEDEQLAFYARALPQLGPGLLRSAVASILAGDAQHLAVIRSLRGERLASSAFVGR